jgi:hypothetical protein
MTSDTGRSRCPTYLLSWWPGAIASVLRSTAEFEDSLPSVELLSAAASSHPCRFDVATGARTHRGGDSPRTPRALGRTTDRKGRPHRLRPVTEDELLGRRARRTLEVQAHSQSWRTGDTWFFSRIAYAPPGSRPNSRVTPNGSRSSALVTRDCRLGTDAVQQSVRTPCTHGCRERARKVRL